MATNKSPRTSPKSKGVINNKRMTEFWSKVATTREESSPQSHPNKQIKTKHVVNNNIPLAANTFVGQQGIAGENGLLRFLIMCDKIPSMILWGPSGTGKTTLAKIIANSTKSIFKEFSGITHVSEDLKKAFNDAKNAKRLIPGTKTIIFIDEIHRFNKGQQDLLSSHMESGDITLIENPSFKLISTLLSRCMICKLNKLSPDEVYDILKRAIQKIQFDQEKVKEVRVSKEYGKFNNQISKEDIMKIFQKSHLPYDKNGDEHYNIVSAFIKSLRGSDANASLYWLGRMLNSGEDPLFIARRLTIFASEDIGVADNNALVLATSTYQACQFIGIPECEINLAHCVTYLAEAPKKYLPSELKRKVFLDVYKPTKRDDNLDNYRHFYYYFDDSRFDNNDNIDNDDDNVKSDNVKSDNVKSDYVKSDYVKSNCVKSDNVDAMKAMKMEQ
ncbi:7249_t:CDS:10 [Diversispora eburnea]|uniref:7249_t:CDS:1 n=1 Tax=Diversispora eburnea TaxID=1213867 RepID=A0A9N8YN48_9GLOM|nr:7249_t:CDS:10 [Diversispora eburnea]